MLKTLILLLAISLLQFCTVAQNTSATLSGQVKDKESGDPVSFSHIVGNKRQIITNANGEFSIQVDIGDTLTFSHVNFERYSIFIADNPENDIIIFLSKKERLMQEIIIHDYLPEDEFKQEVVEHEVKYTEAEVNAMQNVEFSTLLYKKGYVPEMNSLDNFKNYMKEPQGVSLFSSDPSKGLIKSIQRLSTQNKTHYPNTLNLNKTDTVKFKSLYQFID
ncbi:carboxypeptidase-like regulatory domain-containing protein [Reichenbachiella sp.]|uniref:carboxypeptidase-like regulatory domain-containing protein n=1 Tax=Reichenbachiella sp. TaxID=2184521 RepID=UPI003BAE1F76